MFNTNIVADPRCCTPTPRVEGKIQYPAAAFTQDISTAELRPQVNSIRPLTTMSHGVLASTTFHREEGSGRPGPFSGLVVDTLDAFRLVLASEKGLVPRIIQRSKQSDRMHMIASGSVIIFSVQESGIKRWRDGLLWSPSRIEGNFLVSLLNLCVRSCSQCNQVYKEMDPFSGVEQQDASGGHPKAFVKVDGLRKRVR